MQRTFLHSFHPKLLALSLAAASVVSLTACGGRNDGTLAVASATAMTPSVTTAALGDSAIGSPSTQQITSTNPNGVSYTLTPAASGSAFVISGCEGELAPRASSTLTVSYTPSDVGVVATETLSLSAVPTATAGAGALVATVALTGTGVFAAPSRLSAFVPAAPGVALASIAAAIGVSNVAPVSIPGLTSMSDLVPDSDSKVNALYTMGVPNGISTFFTLDATSGASKGSVEVPSLQLQAIQAGAKSGVVLAMSYKDAPPLPVGCQPYAAAPGQDPGVPCDPRGAGSNALASVNTVTGEAVILATTQFSSGGWVSFLTDSAANRAYIVSGDNTVYTYNLTTGELLFMVAADPTYSLQALQLGRGGLLVGVARNYVTSQNAVVTVAPATGAMIVLSTLNFSGDTWIPSTLVSEPNSNSLYAVSGDGALYTFDSTTGVTRAVAPMPAGWQYGVLQVGSRLACPAGSLFNSATQQCSVS